MVLSKSLLSMNKTIKRVLNFLKFFLKNSNLSLIGNDFIEIENLQPYNYIGARFCISGWVDLSWFESDAGIIDWRIFIDYLDLDVKTFMGTAPYPRLDDKNMKGDKVRFSLDCELSWVNATFIQNSHGRITIKIESPNKNISPVYIPLIVKQFEDEKTHNPEIIKQHSSIGKTEIKYNNDLKVYYQEMNKVYESRKSKDHGKSYKHLYNEATVVASDIFKILDGEEGFEKYTYTEEDSREDELNKKYKDALEWRGPLVGGIVSRFSGFELRVYSDDHDKHFHVIHKGKSVDARFSFPDMSLMNYKNIKNTISAKMEKKIREYCLRPEIFTVFEKEFNKREQ